MVRRLGAVSVALVLAGLGAVMLGVVGCSEAARRPANGVQTKRMGDDLFDSAYASLEREDQFHTDEALNQVIGRLNQWIAGEKASASWEIDPLVKTLPDEPPQLAQLAQAGAAQLRFTAADGEHLREAVWLRDIARHATAGRTDDLARAQALFDWTIRNVQLDEPGQRGSYLPWETLLFGHGTAEDRAWLFVLLARQQRLDVVMLALPDDAQPGGVRPWLPALLVDDELYLFDTELGLPIPGPQGKPVATLSQVVANEELLRQLDLDEGAYSMTGADLKQGVVALVEASPSYLAKRMEMVESRLAGERTLVLSAQPSELAERLEAVDHVRQTKLWPLPYLSRLARQKPDAAADQAARKELAALAVEFPSTRVATARLQQGRDPGVPTASLWKGRVLHFRGIYAGRDESQETASLHYQEARISDEEVEALVRGIADHTLAVMEQQNPQAQLERIPLEVSIEDAIRAAGQHASYWLGLLNYERGNYSTAVDYFHRHTLERSPDGPWTFGAEYNLARAHEAAAEEARQKNKPDVAQEHVEKALKLYSQDTSPQRHGNLLRARRLQAEYAVADRSR